ncbi:MAG: hypothetical protein GXO61_05690 [Epsilonproteobacteria bacterium]|nr:hypothetical protein [Campylobacterota bacterium]
MENVLIVEAEIIPNGKGGWAIRCKNTETGEVEICNSIQEYSAFLNKSIYSTSKENFQAVWLESPQATPAMIADVREKLMNFYKQLEEN